MSYYNLLYCHIRPEGLLSDAERDLLAIAKFLVLLIIDVNKTKQALCQKRV